MESIEKKILDVAELLIRQYGVSGVSYQHISHVVGIPKENIHYHYPNEENIVEALLNRCNTKYGNNYRTIVNNNVSAPQKLKDLASVYLDGLQNQQLCLVGMFSHNINSLQQKSREILSDTIKNTVNLFTKVFKQGKEDGTLKFDGEAVDSANVYYSFLMEAQISAKENGDCESFKCEVELTISSWIK